MSRIMIGGHGPATAPGPEPGVLPGWRAACLVYKNALAAGRRAESGVHRECVAAYLEAMPGVSPDEASEQVVKAIFWASVEHNAWLNGREEG